MIKTNKRPTNSLLNSRENVAPIFICGLPRSGTTLVEHIISSHSLVSAGDELFALTQATHNVLAHVKPKSPFPHLFSELKPQHWQLIGQEYIKLTRPINTKRHFTDKMPLNYKVLGLIALSLPKAKIVVCQRNPLDVLLGAFKQLLGKGNSYAYNLDELSDFIIAHHQLVSYWQAVLPEKIHVVQYEDLVNQQRSVTKRLLNHLELSWQDSCIDFHLNPRTVHTISNTQIRNPISKMHLNSWFDYQEQLAKYVEKFRRAKIL